MSTRIFTLFTFTFKKCIVHTRDTLCTIAINFPDIEYVGVNPLSRFIFSKVYRYPEGDRPRNSYLIESHIFPIPPIKRRPRTVLDAALKLIQLFFMA